VSDDLGAGKELWSGNRAGAACLLPETTSQLGNLQSGESIAEQAEQAEKASNAAH
jgi:hypothetical protein